MHWSSSRLGAAAPPPTSAVGRQRASTGTRQLAVPAQRRRKPPAAVHLPACIVCAVLAPPCHRCALRPWFPPCPQVISPSLTECAMAHASSTPPRDVQMAIFPPGPSDEPMTPFFALPPPSPPPPLHSGDRSLSSSGMEVAPSSGPIRRGRGLTPRPQPHATQASSSSSDSIVHRLVEMQVRHGQLEAEVTYARAEAL